MARASARTTYSAFISHAKADEKPAKEIAALLEERGFKCWIAPRDVRAGHAYGDEIVRGIEKSRAFILVLSKASNGSAFVAREVERAVSKGKAVYAIRVEDVQPSPSLELFISGTQWIDAWSGGLSQHIDSLAKLLRKKKDAPQQVASVPEPEPEPKRRPRLPLLLGGAAGAIAVLAVGLWVLKPFTQDGGSERAGSSVDDPNYQACAKLSGDAAINFCGLAIASGQLSGKDLAATYLNRGYERDDKGDANGALADYSAAIETYPSYALAYYNRGGVYRRMGKLDLALKDLNDSISYDAKDPNAFNIRGVILKDQKDLDNALKDFDAALKLDPSHVNALTNRGDLYRQAGKRDLAVADYQKVLTLSTDDAIKKKAIVALSELGVSTADKGADPDYQGCEKLSGIAAVAACDRAIASQGFGGKDLAELYRMRGWERRQKGDSDGAMADYTEAIEIDPANSTAYHNRGDLSYALNAFDRALDDFNQSIKLNDSVANVFWGRGRVYQAKGEIELARDDYTKALALKPDDASKPKIEASLQSLNESSGAATASGNTPPAPSGASTGSPANR
jgi:tetratricopeptide (TPR) repeat protein